MDIWIGAYRPFAVDLLKRQFGSSPILNRLGITNVEVALKCFGQEPP